MTIKELLEEIYLRYNRRESVHPDPLEFLYRYSCVEDREIAGLVASGLAYGRVRSILNSVEKVLTILGDHPSRYLSEIPQKKLEEKLKPFRHRFTSGADVAVLLRSAASVQHSHGLVGNLLAELTEGAGYLEALDELTVRLGGGYLLPGPARGSACKRLHLFMRWMVRTDEVDPGGWEMISPADLVVPVDVHMHRIGQCLGFTERKNADGRTALEITEGFRKILPEDPVKYDFCLTRYGIQNLQSCELFQRLHNR